MYESMRSYGLWPDDVYIEKKEHLIYRLLTLSLTLDATARRHHLFCYSPVVSHWFGLIKSHIFKIRHNTVTLHTLPFLTSLSTSWPRLCIPGLVLGITAYTFESCHKFEYEWVISLTLTVLVNFVVVAGHQS